MVKKNILNSSCYTFPAVRGIQAEREYYIVMCQLRTLSRIFMFNEEELPAQLRVQRILNKARIPEMVDYVTKNNNNYIFSAITASIDGETNFIPIKEKGVNSKIGTLSIDMGSNIIVNDGQHRRAAIIEALKRNPELGDETISVVFYKDRGLKQSQQMFTDLNKNAVKPNKSLSILYDRRDAFSSGVVDILDSIPIFANLTDMEKTTISNRAHKTFTLNIIYSATANLLGKKGKKKQPLTEDEKALAIEFWNETSKNIEIWNKIINKEMLPFDSRKNDIATSGIFLCSLGLAGHELIKEKNWEKRLKKLRKIDYSRKNKLWKGKCIINGKLTKMNHNIKIMSIYFKEIFGLKLNSEETKLLK